MLQKFLVYFLFAIFGFLLFTFSGCTSKIIERPLKSCIKIHGASGPEDFAIHKPSKMLYISSHNRRKFEEENGKIFYIDLKNEEKDWKIIELNGNYPANFKPHGISLVEKEGKQILYVISHPKNKEVNHTIEIFEIANNKLNHLKTLTDPTLTSPNDLFALPNGKIFVSNDHGTGGKFRNLLDDAFKLKRSKIAYFNGVKWSEIGPSVALGNGIFHRIENGIEYIYRSTFMAGSIHKYQLTELDGNVDLKFISEISINSGADNIETDEEGNLYVVGHPSTWKFLRHASNAKNPSPTQVFTIDKELKVREIYANSGEEISAGSTAVLFENKIFISQVFEDYLLICNSGK